MGYTEGGFRTKAFYSLVRMKSLDLKLSVFTTQGTDLSLAIG
jgi:hypothetical protein